MRGTRVLYVHLGSGDCAILWNTSTLRSYGACSLKWRIWWKSRKADGCRRDEYTVELHEIKPADGARRSRKRVGRGIAAGKGKTAGRGTKGLGARSGSGGRLYREGGNLPFVRKLPFKRGFTNLRRLVYVEVNVEDIEARFNVGAEVNPSTLAQAGFMKDAYDKPVVILGRGELSKAVNVFAHRFTRGALEKIEAAGGSATVLESGTIS